MRNAVFIFLLFEVISLNFMGNFSVHSTHRRPTDLGGNVSGHWNIGEYLVPSAHIYMLHIIEKFLYLFRDKWNSFEDHGDLSDHAQISVEERRAETDSYMRVLISERLSVWLRFVILKNIRCNYAHVLGTTHKNC